MKKIIFFTAILLAACGGKQKNYPKAEGALDAGREFIGACLVGDFSKAAFFMLPSENNNRILKDTEKTYREKDKEGRQQYRLASINISEVTDLNADTTIIKYSNSYDKIPHTLQVLRKNDSWLVDLSTNPNPYH